MKQRKFLKIATAAMIGMAAILAAPVNSARAADAEKITYLLPAPPFLPAFGPWMLAKARGYYKAEGLEVTFRAARGGVDVAKQVGAGNAVIGGGIGDTPIIVRANGIPIKAVAVLGGQSLTQLVALKGSGINGPKDMKGKTITTLSYQDTTYYALLGALSSAGLTKDDVKIQGAGPRGVWQLFIAGKADAMVGVPDWIGLAYAAGKKLTIMPVDKYFPSMAQAILASDDTIAKRPELIGKLVRATLKGLKDIMTDPASAAVDYVKAVPQHKGKEKAMESVFRLYNKYVYPGQKTLGAMDPDRLKKVRDFYVSQGIVRKSTPLNDLYTNAFVSK
jgi:NitT/TauT family transport system substrate-binding protein